MKAGIKTFEQAGVDSIYKEMKQFHDREVVKPLRPCDVTYDIKRRALGYLMFLKRNPTVRLKHEGVQMVVRNVSISLN